MSNEKAVEKWNKLSFVPETALKKIEFGKLKGKSDINPQWKIKKMTETFGFCGIGWKYEICDFWTDDGAPIGEEYRNKLLYCKVAIYIKDDGRWSDPIYGIGGDYLLSKDKNGIKDNDDAYKAVVTDALGNAMKYLGVASSIYEGSFDGSKYIRSPFIDVPVGSEEIELISKDDADRIKSSYPNDIIQLCLLRNKIDRVEDIQRANVNSFEMYVKRGYIVKSIDAVHNALRESNPFELEASCKKHLGVDTIGVRTVKDVEKLERYLAHCYAKAQKMDKKNESI